MSHRLRSAIVLLLLAGCEVGTLEVASRFIKSAPASVAEGGLLEVTAEDDAELAGAVLELPAASLSGPVTLTVERGAQELGLAGDRRAGAPVAWGPADALLALPARVTLPFTLQEGQSAARLIIRVEQGDTRHTLPHEALQVDEAGGVVHFVLEQRLATVQAWTDEEGGGGTSVGGACEEDTDCAAGLHCSSHVCKVDD